jgi:hypothetical protein
MTAAAVHETSLIKRRRSTQAEVRARRDALLEIVAGVQPMTVRQVFYQATIRGLVEKAETGNAKILKTRRGGTEASTRTSPLARQAVLVAEQMREIEHLKERLAAAEARDGSLFDLRRGSIRDIVDVIIPHVTPGRVEGTSREIMARFKNKKTPAG